MRSGVPAHLYDPATADQWPADRSIPAQAIREVLTGDHTEFDPRGLRIVGARITGDVDFAHITFDHPLHLLRCRIDRPMNLSNVRLRELKLSGSRFRSLDLDEASITGSLVADRIITHGVIRAVGATINGQLDLDDAHLRNPGDEVLSLHNATISGGVFARRVTTDGGIAAHGSTIGGELNMNGAQLCNPGRDVLVLDRATLNRAFVAYQIVTEGEIRALGATINGELDLDDALLRNPGHDVLSLHNATITSGFFARRITTDGEISTLDATIDGQLNLTGAHLHNPGRDVLVLNRSTVTGGFFARRMATDGEISALDAIINGQLALHGSCLRNAGNFVLALDGATVTGDITATCITTDGVIRAVDATINGQLDLRGSDLRNPKAHVLALDGATVTGALLAGNADAGPAAISEFRATGVLSARRARFENHLDLRGAKPRSISTDHLKIDLDSVTVRELSLPAHGCIDLDLSRAKITNLITPDDQEPQYPVLATGWEIGDLRGHIRTDPAAANRWLTHAQARDVSPQPWHALATVYERNGHPTEGRRLRYTAANKVTKAAPWRSKLPRWLYRYSAGHGYHPLRAAWLLLAALMAGFLLVEMNREHFVPTSLSEATTVADTVSGEAAPAEVEQSRTITGADDCAIHPQYPCLDAFSYALTGVLPAATGITRPDWAISTDAPLWLKAGIPALRILAWIFAAILLAGVTGLLRKSA
ncbi:hypothetical protein NVV99_23620 [Rhodococcus sp. PAE-6]|uniref:hypothetical protein n=1 Tax=Rhodococcus sp. PAE-6 TaxID=2972477 RepID=UPI0021B38FA9|nr:hypothetical protein [Rhodococcus sp. PAE-6]MCT7293898.1 hypothetical protein [Rhodococcus sp. PAE-6]